MKERKLKRDRIFVLNDPHALRVSGELAKEIGLNESIVLLQIEFLISISDNERDGKFWTYQSVRDLKLNYFPWWSIATINRTIQDLVKAKLLTVDNFNDHKYDKTRWMCLGEGVNELKSITLYQNDTRSAQIDTRSAQIDTRSAQIDTTIPETTSETTTESSSLFAQVDSSQSTTSASSRKREPKQERQVKGALCQPDVPGGSQTEVFGALSEVCRLDTKIKRVATQVGKAASELRAAGYTAPDVVRFGQWWYANDFRGRQGQVPGLNLIPTLIPQSRSVAPPPEAPTEHRYEVDTLRDWLKQWAWEEWKRVIAVQLGKLPTDAPAFREWYAAEYSGLDEAGLRQWWREQEQARKETI